MLPLEITIKSQVGTVEFPMPVVYSDVLSDRGTEERANPTLNWRNERWARRFSFIGSWP